MAIRAPRHARTAPTPSSTPLWSGRLHRKCACSGSAGVREPCTECRDKRHTLQRSPTRRPEATTLPHIEDDALRSPGPPLDLAPRARESRFGHDFSRVRVHADARAGAGTQSGTVDPAKAGLLQRQPAPSTSGQARTDASRNTGAGPKAPPRCPECGFYCWWIAWQYFFKHGFEWFFEDCDEQYRDIELESFDCRDLKPSPRWVCSGTATLRCLSSDPPETEQRKFFVRLLEKGKVYRVMVWDRDNVCEYELKCLEGGAELREVDCRPV